MYPTVHNQRCGPNFLTITSLEHCQYAQKWKQENEAEFKESKFINASGDGSDLPKGCISDKTSGNHYVYWNPEGNKISGDEKIKLICNNPDPLSK